MTNRLRAFLVLLAAHLARTTAKLLDYTPDNFFHFVTRPDLTSPRWTVDVYEPDALQQGYYWFLSPYAKLDQEDYFSWNGPILFDMQGDLIWSGTPYMQHNNVFDFRVSRVDGQDMLSFNSPFKKDGHNNGYILDQTYNLYRAVDTQGNMSKHNMHDLNLIDDGKRALVLLNTEYDATHLSVDGFEGPCNIGWQGFKEIDVATGEVLFEWHSKDHISVDETTYVPTATEDTWEDKCAARWDITHFNSIDKFADGDYLLSSRHTDTLYKISHLDHSIVWRLGGLKSDFVVKDDRARFTRQHHSRVRGQNETHIELSVFDNALGSGNFEEQSSSESWGLHLALRTDTDPMELSLVHRYSKPISADDGGDPGMYLVASRGSMDILPNGNVFMGWTMSSLISEHDPTGRLLMKARMVQRGADSYRSYKMAWKGYPSSPPDVVSQVRERRTGNLTTTVYVSWNGATEVATWDVLHTNRYGNITELVASSPRKGFETKLTVDRFVKEVIVVAIDADGDELGRSVVIHSDIPEDLKSLATAAGELEWMRTHHDSWWTTDQPTHALPTGGLFVLGLLCSVGIVLVLIPVCRRRKTAWMGALRFNYKSVAADEEELIDREHLLDGKARNRDMEEPEEAYSTSKAVT